MTISSTTNKSGPYIENGVTTEFEYAFKIEDETHIQVVRAVGVVETILTPGTHYTVTGVGNDKGNVVLSAPASGSTLTLLRDVPFVQELDLENQGAYFAEQVEAAFDMSVARDQQLAEELSRTVKVPVSSDPADLEPLIGGVVQLLNNVDAVVAVADISGGVVEVAAIAPDVTAVAAIAPDVTAVAAIAPDVTAVAANMAAIQDAPAAALAAAASAAAAAASAASVDVDAVLKSYLGIIPAITRWKAEQSSSRVLWAGTSLAVETTNVGGGLLAAGRTHVSGAVGEAIRQDGFIRTAKLGVSTVGSSPANNLKLKVLRPNGASYDLIAESEYLTATATGMNTFSLTSPLPVQPGDQIGVWMKGGAAGTCTQLSAATTTAVYRYIEGDAGTGATWIDVAGTSILSDYQGIKPFAVCFGESIFEGHNGATNWHSFAHLGPAGNPAAEPFNQVRALIPSLDYQNYAIGGSLWSSVAARAAVATTWAQPKVAVVAAGVNDVAAGTPWSTVLSNMNAFKTALPAGTKIFVCEMMPYHIGTDAQAATIRAWNVNYAAWCAENGATLIKCWDAMGQIRPSTGFKDDLISAYHYGGGHLTVPAGVDAYAKLISDGLQSVLWI